MSNAEEVLKKIKEWLQEEVTDNQDVVDAKDNDKDYNGYPEDNIIYGRHECAECLLENIKKWEDI